MFRAIQYLKPELIETMPIRVVDEIKKAEPANDKSNDITNGEIKIGRINNIADKPVKLDETVKPIPFETIKPITLPTSIGAVERLTGSHITSKLFKLEEKKIEQTSEPTQPTTQPIQPTTQSLQQDYNYLNDIEKTLGETDSIRKQIREISEDIKNTYLLLRSESMKRLLNIESDMITTLLNDYKENDMDIFYQETFKDILPIDNQLLVNYQTRINENAQLIKKLFADLREKNNKLFGLVNRNSDKLIKKISHVQAPEAHDQDLLRELFIAERDGDNKYEENIKKLASQYL